jgi:hypothetical protein
MLHRQILLDWTVGAFVSHHHFIDGAICPNYHWDLHAALIESINHHLVKVGTCTIVHIIFHVHYMKASTQGLKSFSGEQPRNCWTMENIIISHLIALYVWLLSHTHPQSRRHESPQFTLIYIIPIIFTSWFPTLNHSCIPIGFNTYAMHDHVGPEKSK